jgi:DNA-binding MarR family transcriptional regulator
LPCAESEEARLLSLVRALLEKPGAGQDIFEKRVLELIKQREPFDHQDLLLALQAQGLSAREILSAMEARGLILRRKNPSDRRRTEALLTEAGRELIADSQPPNRLLEALGPDELACLQTILAKMEIGLNQERNLPKAPSTDSTTQEVSKKNSERCSLVQELASQNNLTGALSFPERRAPSLGKNNLNNSKKRASSRFQAASASRHLRA